MQDLVERQGGSVTTVRETCFRRSQSGHWSFSQAVSSQYPRRPGLATGRFARTALEGVAAEFAVGNAIEKITKP
jgi:hypothetical protein